MCNIPQMANESNLQFLVKVTGVTQLETKKCGACDVPTVRPVIMDDTSGAEHACRSVSPLSVVLLRAMPETTGSQSQARVF